MQKRVFSANQEKNVLEQAKALGVASTTIIGGESLMPQNGNIKEDTLKDVFENHPLLNILREIYVSDIAECRACTCADFCNFCFAPHITANHGELGKVDSEYCKFVALRKQLAQKRDDI